MAVKEIERFQKVPRDRKKRTPRVRGQVSPIVTYRQSMVAQLLLRYYTPTEIQEQLHKLAISGDDPLLNRESADGLWSLPTISADKKKIELLWRANSVEKMDIKKAKLEATIAQLLQNAWNDNDYDLCLKCVDRLIKLYGLEHIDITSGGKPIEATVQIYLPQKGSIDERQD